MKTDRPYVVAGPAEALARLGPWLEARRARQPVIVLENGAAELVAHPERFLPPGCEAALVVGPKRRSPATFLPGLFLRDAEGNSVPVGWLPDVGARLAVFAAAAARVLARAEIEGGAPDRGGGLRAGAPDGGLHPGESGESRHSSRRHLATDAVEVPPRRDGSARVIPFASGVVRATATEIPELPPAASMRAPAGGNPKKTPAIGPGSEVCARQCAPAQPRLPGPVVVLGQWQDRFLRVSARTVRWFERRGGVSGVFRWTSERIVGPDLVRALQHGPGLAFYYGHGRSRGFAGYHGLRAKHLPATWPEPIAAILAVCCEAASRRRIGLSFIEDLVLRGAVAGALAATRRTLHDHNRQLGPACCEAITPGDARTLAEIVQRAPIAAGILPGPYRFIGDPAIPLLGARDAATKCAEVFAPAPDSELPAFPVNEIELPAEVLAS